MFRTCLPAGRYKEYKENLVNPVNPVKKVPPQAAKFTRFSIKFLTRDISFNPNPNV